MLELVPDSRLMFDPEVCRTAFRIDIQYMNRKTKTNHGLTMLNAFDKSEYEDNCEHRCWVYLKVMVQQLTCLVKHKQCKSPKENRIVVRDKASWED